MFNTRTPLILLVILFLAGCQNLAKNESVPDPTASWQKDRAFFSQQVTDVSLIDAWKMSGKVGVVAPGINQAANMIWDRGADTSSLKLYGPLGVGAVEIVYDDETASLSDSKGNEKTGDTPEELLFEVLGWQVPFNALRYWLRAVPQPDYAYDYRLNAETQHLSELRQRGWHLYFSKYSLGGGDEKILPKKIIAKKNLLVDGEEEEVTIRFIVRSLTEVASLSNQP